MNQNARGRLMYVGDTEIGARGVEACLAESGFDLLDFCLAAEQAHTRIDQLGPSLVLIGRTIPEHRGFVLCRKVTARWPRTAIILFGGRRSDDLVKADAAYMGASACVLINASCDEINSTVSNVLAGRMLFSREHLDLGFGVEELTKSQARSLELASECATIPAIADRLGVSAHTARNHLSEARSKLGVRTTQEAVARALRRGAIQDS